ncbi:MAG TPA: hypothetical protein VEU33_13395 [Archangium sp.]|nr:hypothetical protein [Archangium sp.]
MRADIVQLRGKNGQHGRQDATCDARLDELAKDHSQYHGLSPFACQRWQGFGLFIWREGDELMAATDLKNTTVREVLARMVKEGKLLQTGTGRKSAPYRYWQVSTHPVQ